MSPLPQPAALLASPCHRLRARPELRTWAWPRSMARADSCRPRARPSWASAFFITTWMAVLRSMGSPGAAAAGASATDLGLSPLQQGERWEGREGKGRGRGGGEERRHEAEEFAYSSRRPLLPLLPAATARRRRSARIPAIAPIAAGQGCTQPICPSPAPRLPLLSPTLPAAARTRQTCWSSTDKLPPCVFFLWEEPAGKMGAASGSSAARHSKHSPCSRCHALPPPAACPTW